MKKINISQDSVKEFLVKNFKFSIYEIAWAGIFVALWAVSALPVFSINFGFMRMGITYVWPILLGLTSKPAMAILCAIIGDNMALLSSGTGFGQWMPEYAVIPIMIVTIVLLFKKLIWHKSEMGWWIMIAFANIIFLLGTLITMIVQSDFQYSSKFNSDRVFDFRTDTAKAVVWVMYALVTLVQLVLLILYVFIKYEKVRVKRLQFVNAKNIKDFISFYALSMIVIVITIWLWGPFAQIRYLNVYGKVPNSHSYKEYDLFLIPRILKTPISLTLYTIFIIPIYKTNEIVAKSVGVENKW